MKRSSLLLRAVVCAGLLGAVHAQITFTISDDGPTIGFPDPFLGLPIRAGDLLSPAKPSLSLGPLSQPAGGGTGGPLGLAIPTYPATAEVDALSSGINFNDPAALPPEVLQWRYSVDEFAVGIPAPLAPNVLSEGGAPLGAFEAGADAFIPVSTLPGPVGPFAVPPDHTATIDGNGFRSASGYGYPGVGLLEWNPPGPPPDLGDDIDGLETDLNTFFGIFFSLEGPLLDPLTGVPGSGSAGANGFVGGDVLWNGSPSSPPVLYASAAQLGLDALGADTDDLDALVVWENGTLTYEPSQVPYDWLSGATDMLLFSVRRGSAIIGMPDSFFGVGIEEGDILYPVPGGPPGIFYAAENLGLATKRNFPVAHGDELDALDIADVPLLDCNANGMEDAWDIAFGGAPDCNKNGIPDVCDIASGNSADVFPNDGVPDECQCGQVASYCTAKTNSLGCTPIIWSKGSPCVTCAAPFTIDAVNIVSKKNGLLFYGFGPGAFPFLGGTLCVMPPLRRTPILNSGGVIPPPTCSGSYTFDMNGWIQSAIDPFLVIGTTVYAQFWYRDPAIGDGTGTGLTDALTFTLCN